MRTIIEIPESELDLLTRYCRREGISRAEAVRRAIARMLKEAGASAEADAFGLWSKKRRDGVAYQQKARREWETRRR